MTLPQRWRSCSSEPRHKGNYKAKGRGTQIRRVASRRLNKRHNDHNHSQKGRRLCLVSGNFGKHDRRNDYVCDYAYIVRVTEIPALIVIIIMTNVSFIAFWTMNVLVLVICSSCLSHLEAHLIFDPCLL